MTALTDFLLARINEDEGLARTASPSPWSPVAYDGETTVQVGNGGSLHDPGEYAGSHGSIGFEDCAHLVRWQPARVLAECEAKRRIVEQLTHIEAGVLIVGTNHAEYRSALQFAVRALALPYSDHLDYQQEWTP